MTSGGIYGVVLDEKTDCPLAGVEVSARSHVLWGTMRVVTSTSGQYMFAKLPPGDYGLAFSREGRTVEKWGIQVLIRRMTFAEVLVSFSGPDSHAGGPFPLPPLPPYGDVVEPRPQFPGGH